MLAQNTFQLLHKTKNTVNDKAVWKWLDLTRARTLSSSSITGRVAGFLTIRVPSSIFPMTNPPVTTAYTSASSH